MNVVGGVNISTVSSYFLWNNFDHSARYVKFVSGQIGTVPSLLTILAAQNDYVFSDITYRFNVLIQFEIKF